MVLSHFKISACILCVFLISIQLEARDTLKRKDMPSKIFHPDEMVRPTHPEANVADFVQASVFTDVIIYNGSEGIDVSHYQGRIDWQAVSQSNVSYVYIKASEGSSNQDDCYYYNITEARRAGLKVGSYHFFRAKANLDEQLQNMTSVVKREQQDIIPVIDVEKADRVSGGELVRRLKNFLRLVEQHYGCKPIIYTFVNFYNKYFSYTSELDEYPFMIAFYRDDPPELNDGRKYVMWQYTCAGYVDGINSDVDRSKMMNGYNLNDIIYR